MGVPVIYSDSKEKAAEYSTKAFERLQADGFTQHPDNFAVWYLYYSGRAPEIIKSIDILESNNQKISDQTLAELFAKHLGLDEESTAVHETSARVQDALAKVISVLDEGNKDASNYSENLAGFAGALGSGGDLTALRETVLSIAAETKNMMAHTRKLDKMLSDTSQQMASMRNHLESIRKETVTDALTGINNRKYFDDYLRNSAMQAMETGAPLAIMMTDIDFFKKFNDTWGHQTGDEVLRLVAKVLQSVAKQPYAACRYGGEEFSIIMPKTALRDALTVAEHVRGVVEKKKIVRRQSSEDLGNITMSIGVSQYAPGESLNDFVHRADAALYKAKHEGRNRVMAADETTAMGH